MKSIALLIALPLFAGCGVRTLISGEYPSLKDCITECVDEAWGDVKDLSHSGGYSGGYSGGSSTKANNKAWHYKLPFSEAEMGDRVLNLRDLLLTKLEEAGADINGLGSTGTPDNLVGFDIEYRSASEEGMVWARRVSHGDEDNSIFIVFHGVNIN